MKNDNQVVIRVLAVVALLLLFVWAFSEGPRKVQDWLELAAKTAGAVVPISILGAWLYRPIRQLLQEIRDGIETATSVKNSLDAVERKMNEVSIHVLPNGGGSITDKIDVVNKAVNGITKVISQVDMRARATWMLSGTPIYECDEKGDCIYANPALCHVFGLSDEDMQGAGWGSAILPAQRLTVIERWRAMTAARVPYSDQFTVVNQQTGEKVEVTSQATAFQDDVGNIIGYIGTIIPKGEDDERKYHRPAPQGSMEGLRRFNS